MIVLISKHLQKSPQELDPAVQRGIRKEEQDHGMAFTRSKASLSLGLETCFCYFSCVTLDKLFSFYAFIAFLKLD